MRRAYLLAAIVVATLNLRPALVTIGPVLPLIGQSLSLSSVALGVLTSLPILMLGVAGGIAEPFGRRIGWSAGVVVACLFIAAGTALRSAGNVMALFAGAIVLGAGIGLGNVYVPTLLKWGFAKHLGLVMGIYTCCLATGAMVSVSATPFVLHHFNDDWRPALAVWMIPAVAGVALWLPLLRLHGGTTTARSVPLWRNRLAWSVTAYMGFQSTMFYSLAAWYPALLHERGLSLVTTSLNLSILFVTQMIFALIVPIVLVRIPRQEIIGGALPAVVAIGIVGALYGPFEWIPFWSAVLGLALGGVFGVALSFMVLRAQHVESAARLSGMAQTVGYVVASIGPLGIGLLHASPEPLLATTIWLVTLALATMVSGSLAGQNAFVEGEAALT